MSLGDTILWEHHRLCGQMLMETLLCAVLPVDWQENGELERLGNVNKPGTGGGLASVSRLSFPCPWPQRGQTFGGCSQNCWVTELLNREQKSKALALSEQAEHLVPFFCPLFQRLHCTLHIHPWACLNPAAC